MNSRLLLSASAAFLALTGGVAFILPQELLAHFGAAPTEAAVVFVEMMGGVYIGFAMLNWMARGNPIGGIYSRPVAVGNFTHFFAVAIVLLKQLMVTAYPAEWGIGAALYSVFAAGYGFLVFGPGPAER
jgi:hypothetical protein